MEALKEKTNTVVYIKDPKQYEKLRNKGLVVVDFKTSWCNPCRKFAPIFEKMAEENPGVAFLSVDAEEITHTDCEDIQSVPTFKIFLNGEKKREFSGVDKERLDRYLQRYSVQIYVNGKLQRTFSQEEKDKILEYMNLATD